MDLYPLLHALSDGNFHSGEALGAQLGVSRTAVWKQIQALRKLGVELHAVTGKGYRLPEPMDLLSRRGIAEHSGLDADILNSCMALHLSIDSTNLAAMQQAQAGASRYLVLAEHQTQGRGRRGRSWVSPLGRNLYLSLVWSFQNGVAALEGLSLLTALVVVRALERTGVTGLSVKWPNDVLLDGRKLAGILLEVNGDMTGPCKVVIGIGLNVRMPAASAAQIDQAFSDLASAGRVPSRNRIAASLIDELFAELTRFSTSGFGPYRQRWDALDAYRGREVVVQSGAHSIQGRVAGVNSGGALLLDTGKEGVQVISGGEVFPSLRPVADLPASP